jgi:hypothetical protein
MNQIFSFVQNDFLEQDLFNINFQKKYSKS